MYKKLLEYSSHLTTLRRRQPLFPCRYFDKHKRFHITKYRHKYPDNQTSSNYNIEVLALKIHDSNSLLWGFPSRMEVLIFSTKCHNERREKRQLIKFHKGWQRNLKCNSTVPFQPTEDTLFYVNLSMLPLLHEIAILTEEMIRFCSKQQTRFILSVFFCYQV